LETCRELRLLDLRQLDFLRANVIVHARERLQTLHFVAKQVVDFVEGRLAQSQILA
jgi:DNA-binding TFAR19-related protein (PDSD5 family)